MGVWTKWQTCICVTYSSSFTKYTPSSVPYISALGIHWGAYKRLKFNDSNKCPLLCISHVCMLYIHAGALQKHNTMFLTLSSSFSQYSSSSSYFCALISSSILCHLDAVYSRISPNIYRILSVALHCKIDGESRSKTSCSDGSSRALFGDWSYYCGESGLGCYVSASGKL